MAKLMSSARTMLSTAMYKADNVEDLCELEGELAVGGWLLTAKRSETDELFPIIATFERREVIP